MSIGAAGVVAAITAPCPTRSRDEWLAIAGDCQSLINTLTAGQDAAIAEAARRESAWCEDGTLGETVHRPGQVSLDAADLVAPVIGASHHQAQHRVEQAVRLATGRVPVPADDRDRPEASGLGGLHEAMVAGQLDGFRAGVIAFELAVAPADVADAIVTALSGHLGDDAATLRRRTRVLLERISPELLRERAKRARAATGLRRWVAEPGVDEWHGTFPSEDAAAAWAAIDRLAHDLVAAGTCTNIEQARGKALTDLVTSNATIDVQVVLTVPAATGSAHTVPVTTDAAETSSAMEHEAPTCSDLAPLVATTVASRPGTAGTDESLVRTTSGPHLRQATGIDSQLPGIGGRHHPNPAHVDDSQALMTAVPGVPRLQDVPVQPCSHDDDLVEVHGARPSEPLLVRRGWLRDHLAKAPPLPRRARKRARLMFVPCDPLTGGRLDPGDHLATDAYRPSDQLAALVRARDGHCRFPGCSIAARFCDLDHVRPWPIGRTAARNLLTLCRRHHRIKQRAGWRLRLAPDGTATWTDPTGRERTTAPLDALQSLVLAADSPSDRSVALPTADAVPDGPATAQIVDASPDRPVSLPTADAVPDGPATAHSVEALPDRSTSPLVTELPAATTWSALETHLQFRLEHHPRPPREHHLWLPPYHRRCVSAADLRAGLTRRRARAEMPDVPPF